MNPVCRFTPYCTPFLIIYKYTDLKNGTIILIAIGLIYTITDNRINKNETLVLQPRFRSPVSRLRRLLRQNYFSRRRCRTPGDGAENIAYLKGRDGDKYREEETER